MAGLNLRVATEVARALASARRVRMHGVRQNHAFASFLASGLGMLRGDVALLDAAQLGAAEALAQLEPDDVVVVARCAPYTRSVREDASIAAAPRLPVLPGTGPT